MFNPLAPHELLAALATVLRAGADPDRQDDEYGRSQLLSASSVARHLAAEEPVARRELAWLCGALLEALGEDAPPARDRIAAAASSTEIGEALAVMFDGLGPGDAELRARVHRVLAEMAEREVAVLARA